MEIELSTTLIPAGDAELADQAGLRLRSPGVYLQVIEAPMVRLNTGSLSGNFAFRHFLMQASLLSSRSVFRLLDARLGGAASDNSDSLVRRPLKFRLSRAAVSFKNGF